ncbi:MAG: tRNA uracil 4-sulfurtransferase ThiI [Thermoprotei archaeon]
MRKRPWDIESTLKASSHSHQVASKMMKGLSPDLTGREARPVLIGHYSEVALKGSNRSYFESVLARNIRDKLGEGYVVRRVDGRLLVYPPSPDGNAMSFAQQVVSKTFGVRNFSPAYEIPRDDFVHIIPSLFDLSNRGTFRVTVKRSDKSYPFTSIEVQARVGEALLRAYPELRVDLKNPSVTISLEILRDRVLVYEEKLDGLGGLPVGTSGRVLALFSGGIDSPVAAFLSMKRGCDVDLLHFHPFNDAEEVRKSKVARLARVLSAYEPKIKLFAVPYYHFNVAFLTQGDKYQLLLFRRFMMKVASEFARRHGYDALATGDSLGQVASQIMLNLKLIDAAAETLVLRPLIAFDKEEIVALAKRIGTYELSLEPYRDCCSMVALHPSLRPSQEEVEKIEGSGKYDELLERTLGDLREIPVRGLPWVNGGGPHWEKQGAASTRFWDTHKSGRVNPSHEGSGQRGIYPCGQRADQSPCGKRRGVCHRSSSHYELFQHSLRPRGRGRGAQDRGQGGRRVPCPCL